MNRQVVIGVFLALGSVLKAQEADWKTIKGTADAYAREGKTEAAVATLDEALRSARSPRERIEMRLTKAAILERAGSKASEAVDSLYRDALADAQTDSGGLVELRLLTTNNYGAHLLRIQQPQKAVDVLKSVEPEIAKIQEPGARARYYYNLARAYQQSRKPDEAFSRYVQAQQLDLTLKAAGRSASETALAATTPASGISMTTKLLPVFVANRDMTLAGELMRDACSREDWSAAPEYRQLVTGLVTYFKAARLSPEEYASVWAPIVSRARRWSSDRQRLDAIQRLYASELPLVLSPGSTPPPFAAWRDGADAEQFSAFAKMVGDWYFKLGTRAEPDPKALTWALHRYALAWSVSYRNTDAALYLANLLLEQSAHVDPSRQILDQFVNQVFSNKGDAYIGEDWENVLRFHTLLGTIFEKQQKWGPDHDPRSAAFQWEHAIRAQQRLKKGSGSEAPVLHEKLGATYEKLGRPADAWREYLTAAEGNLAHERVAAARGVLQRAAAVRYVPTPTEAARVKAINARTEKMSSGAR